MNTIKIEIQEEKGMRDIWEKKMIEYHLRKKYNLKEDVIIYSKNNHYFYEGVLLQETNQCRKTCRLICRKTHMRWVPHYYEIYL